MSPHLSDGIVIFLSVLASEVVLDAYRRIRKRATMRALNRRSVEARRRAKSLTPRVSETPRIGVEVRQSFKHLLPEYDGGGRS